MINSDLKASIIKNYIQAVISIFMFLILYSIMTNGIGYLQSLSPEVIAKIGFVGLMISVNVLVIFSTMWINDYKLCNIEPHIFLIIGMILLVITSVFMVYNNYKVYDTMFINQVVMGIIVIDIITFPVLFAYLKHINTHITNVVLKESVNEN